MQSWKSNREKYGRQRPGWCMSLLSGKEKYYIKIQKYRKVPLTVSWLAHMSSARQRKVLYKVTEVHKSSKEKYQTQRPRLCISLLPGKEKYYIKIQKYRKVPLTVSWLVHMSSARRGSCATNPHSFCNQPFSNHSDHLQPLFRNMYIL